MFYSKTTGGFYSIDVHGNRIPSDAVEISAAQYSELLSGQANGKIISFDETGVPILVDAPELTYAQLRATEYPSFADQFDLLYHGGYDAWKTAIDAVKIKYPKPEA